LSSLDLDRDDPEPVEGSKDAFRRTANGRRTAVAKAMAVRRFTFAKATVNPPKL
jgi:hypothetical protein